MSHQNIDWKKYLIVFLITASLFLLASWLSNLFTDRKLNQLKDIQDEISIDILSSETQYSLLAELSCKNVSDSLLSGELADLGKRLEWGQENLGATEEVLYLKKYYALLQIKDYLLMKRISARCNIESAFILYFYTTAEQCSECITQGLVLSALREKYPELRVYSFDYSTDLSTVKTMLQIYKIEDTKLPALILDDDLLTGFQSLEELEEKIKATFKLKEKPVEEETEADQD